MKTARPRNPFGRVSAAVRLLGEPAEAEDACLAGVVAGMKDSAEGRAPRVRGSGWLRIGGRLRGLPRLYCLRLREYIRVHHVQTTATVTQACIPRLSSAPGSILIMNDNGSMTQSHHGSFGYGKHLYERGKSAMKGTI
jgi:hypothetical protein